MKKNSDPVEVKNDIIIIGLITKKGIMIKKKWIYGMKSDKYSAGIIFEKIEVNSDDNDELDAK
jgi:hypothetical protein